MLHEALDERTPLLERLKFLAIFTSNLDEFYMKRVGLLRGVAQVRSEDDPVVRGGGARDRLAQIRQTVIGQLEEQARCYRELVPMLARHGIILAEWCDLTEAARMKSRAFSTATSPQR